MRASRKAALALALLGFAATSQAGVKASAVFSGNWTSSPAEAFVPLNDAGATTLSFKLGSAGKKVLTYSAECAVAAPATAGSQFLDLDIYVNGVVVKPTVGSQDAFCSASGLGGGYNGWVRASITIPIQGIEGTNSIRIKARGTGQATGIWLGDSALVIYD